MGACSNIRRRPPPGHGSASFPPPRAGGWQRESLFGAGWTCCVEQGHYGHPGRKPTWLYVVGAEPTPLIWGKSAATGKVDLGFHSTEERRKAVRRGVGVEQFCKRKRAATPPAFAELLLDLARSAGRVAA